MKLPGIRYWIVMIFVLAAGCGGSGDKSDTINATATGKENPSLLASTGVKSPAVDYNAVVQQLYIAYFGRPADTTGLANFEAALSAADAPTNIQDLSAAYNTNATIKGLIDSFGTSTESNTLYAGDTTAFVTAVFKSLFNRSPQPSGLAFWVNAIDSGTLTKGNAALSIMAGALENTSTQGLIDAAVVNNKTTVGKNFTAAITTATQLEGYKGQAAAASVRTMLATVSDTTDTNAFQTTIANTLAALEALINNAAPIANAGGSQSVSVGVIVTLDGSASSDANGNSLTYSWTLTAKPTGSFATILLPTSVNPIFSPDVAGVYVIALMVNNGKTNSATSSVTVTVSAVPQSTSSGTATAICKDGTYSYSLTHSGTCSHHGGVAVWL